MHSRIVLFHDILPWRWARNGCNGSLADEMVGEKSYPRFSVISITWERARITHVLEDCVVP